MSTATLMVFMAIRPLHAANKDIIPWFWQIGYLRDKSFILRDELQTDWLKALKTAVKAFPLIVIFHQNVYNEIRLQKAVGILFSDGIPS